MKAPKMRRGTFVDNTAKLAAEVTFHVVDAPEPVQDTMHGEEAARISKAAAREQLLQNVKAALRPAHSPESPAAGMAMEWTGKPIEITPSLSVEAARYTIEALTRDLTTRAWEVGGLTDDVASLKRDLEYARIESRTRLGDYERACQMVAKMHEAIVGEIRGPDVGPVEDAQAFAQKHKDAVHHLAVQSVALQEAGAEVRRLKRRIAKKKRSAR